MLKLEELRLSKLLFFEKITPATEVPPEVPQIAVAGVILSI